MKREKSKIIINFVFLICIFTAADADDAPHVRVAILKGLKKLSIDGQAILIRDVWTYEPIRDVEEFAGFHLSPDGNMILLNGLKTGTNWMSVIPKRAMMNLNGRPFRGKVEVALDEDNTLVVVNELTIEDYLKGVINHEISSSWEMDAVKAQAIVARTYALYQKKQRVNKFYDLESDVLDQVYGGAQNEDIRARHAVEETRGMVLTHNKELVKPYYFSACGGRTENAENVWGESKPYLVGVKCKFCKNSPVYGWTKRLALNYIEKKLITGGYRVKELFSIRITKKSESGRALLMKVSGADRSVDIKGVEFRKIMGYDVIRSTLFDVKIEGDEAVFSGRGSGHGVGLCQWGAKGMAEAGYNYKKILEHYYPGTEIERWYK